MPSPITPEQQAQWELDNGKIDQAEYQRRLELEVERRRRLIAGPASPDNAFGGGFEAMPPDVADIAVRDISTGRVRKTRGGSTRSAILGTFSPTAPLGSSSILGGA